MEKTVPIKKETLTKEELNLLIQAKNITRKIIYLVGGGLLLMILLSPTILSGINSSIIIIGTLLTIVGMLFAIFILLGNINKDIKNNEKIIIQGKVEEKILGNAKSYIIILNGERELLTKEQYESISINDSIELAKAPLSHTLFSIRKI